MIKQKKENTKKMFNSIAKQYDFLNHFLSFGIDFYWRKKAVKSIKNNPKIILDVATGTGDFAISASSIKNSKIIGIDISEEMLKIGETKIKNHKLEKRISLELLDVENLPFKDNYFDATTIGFGVRNFENLSQGISEVYRTLKNGGNLVILEPSRPTLFPLNLIYKLYFHHIVPIIGKIVSKDKKAYKFLPESVEFFPHGEDFLTYLREAGFKKCKHTTLTFGIVNMYTAIK